MYLITNTSKMPNRSWKSFNHHSINGSQMNETYDTGTVEGRERVRLCWVQLLSGIINSKPVVWPVFLSTFPHVRGLRQTKGSTLWIFCSRVPDRWFELIWILCFITIEKICRFPLWLNKMWVNCGFPCRIAAFQNKLINYN